MSVVVSADADIEYGVGGHLTVDGGLYPTYSTSDYVQRDTGEVGVYGHGGGAVVVVEPDGTLVGGTIRLGAGLGIEASTSVAAGGIGLSLDHGIVLYSQSGSYRFNFFSGQFVLERFAFNRSCIRQL